GLAKAASPAFLGLRWLCRSRHHLSWRDLHRERRRAGARVTIGALRLRLHRSLLGHSLVSANHSRRERASDNVVAAGGLSHAHGLVRHIHLYFRSGGCRRLTGLPVFPELSIPRRDAVAAALAASRRAIDHHSRSSLAMADPILVAKSQCDLLLLPRM